MLRIIIKYQKYLGLIFIMGFLSCNKYLDKKPNDSLVVPTTLEDLQSLLDDKVFMNKKTSEFGEASSDNFFLTEDAYNSDPKGQIVYVWGKLIYSGQSDWASLYTPVYNSNLCLERIQKIAKTSQNEVLWNNVKGSALFFRSYYFSQLAWSFAKAYDKNSCLTDLGIPLRMTANYNDPSVRANVEDTYNRIINDTKDCIPLLPITPTHTVRPSKSAAYGLLARVYLSMRIYDSAFKYSDLALSVKNTLLDYNTINPNSAEPFASLVYGHETIFYSTMARNIGLLSPFTGMVDTTLYASFDENDLRKVAFFGPSNNYFNFKGTYADNRFDFFTGIATDEMYLIRAECYARKGNKDDAMNDLNKILEKRWKNDGTWIPLTANDALESLEIILTERRKELMWRGLRWIDIKRLNKEGANITPTRLISNQTVSLAPNDNRYALPLPDDIVRMTGMPQN